MRITNNVDHNFFKIETPASMYVAGFIAADGNVYQKELKYNSIKIDLSIKDKDHVLKLVNLLNYKNKIRESVYNFGYGKGKSHIAIQFSSKEMCDYLISIGITPRKSLTLKWPNISNKYISHFVRGYFDGDGSITFDKNLRINICGTYSFLSSLKQNFISICNRDIGCICPDHNIWRLRYCGNISAKLFTDWIYKDSYNDIRLDRKYLRYLEFCNINGKNIN